MAAGARYLPAASSTPSNASPPLPVTLVDVARRPLFAESIVPTRKHVTPSPEAKRGTCQRRRTEGKEEEGEADDQGSDKDEQSDDVMERRFAWEIDDEDGVVEVIPKECAVGPVSRTPSPHASNSPAPRQDDSPVVVACPLPPLLPDPQHPPKEISNVIVIDDDT